MIVFFDIWQISWLKETMESLGFKIIRFLLNVFPSARLEFLFCVNQKQYEINYSVIFKIVNSELVL